MAGGGGGIGWGIKGGCVCSKGSIRESSMWRDGEEAGAEGRAEGRGASCELALLIWSLRWQPPLSWQCVRHVPSTIASRCSFPFAACKSTIGCWLKGNRRKECWGC